MKTILQPRVLILGQTPPPFGGQAVMIEKMLEGTYAGATLVHIRMDFSAEMDEIGKFHPKKLWILLRIIFATILARFRTGASVLYYPPAGPNMVPFLRDACILCSLRWLFSKTIFHFHASGISTLYPRLPAPLKLLFRLAYMRPDAAIFMTELGPNDSDFLEAGKKFLIPYGIADSAGDAGRETRPVTSPNDVPRILFVGVVGEEKGVGILLESCRILAERGVPFQCQIVGRFESSTIESKYREFVRVHSLEDHVNFAGVLVGENKWQAYRSADIFCFPSHFAAESFPVVILEAMQFCLPVVSTEWKGIPSQVQHGITGLLTSPQNPELTAQALESLVSNRELRTKLGDAGRRRYEQEFRLETFYSRLDQVWAEVAPHR